MAWRRTSTHSRFRHQMEVFGELFVDDDLITGNETLLRIGCESQLGLKRVWTQCRRSREISLPCTGIDRSSSSSSSLRRQTCWSHTNTLLVFLRLLYNSLMLDGFLFSSCVVSSGRVCRTSRRNSATGVGNFAAVSVWD